MKRVTMNILMADVMEEEIHVLLTTLSGLLDPFYFLDEN